MVLHEQDFPARFAPLPSARHRMLPAAAARRRICRKTLLPSAEPQTSLKYPY
jgi:hypothetical protein